MGVAQNCHNFISIHSIPWGRAAVWFLKMSFMMHCDFDTGSLKINIFKVLFSDGERGNKKEFTVCYPFDNIDTILDDP